MDFNPFEFSLIGQSSGWLDPSWWWAIVQVVVGLGAVIFVHELGHFLVAKACGVKCDKFYIGFDAFDIKIGDRVLIPRRLLHWQWGETEYGVGILPLGGYVKMLGQDDNPAKMAEERERALMTDGDGVDGSALDPRSYSAKSVPQRMAIISAGVVMNLIFAVIFAACAFNAGVNFEPPIVGITIPGSPAWENSLTGCRILSINGERTDDKYYTFNHLTEAIVLGGNDGPLQLEILRPGASEPEQLSIETASDLLGIKGGENLKSLGFMRATTAKLGLKSAVVNGQAAARATPNFADADEITAVDGTPIQSALDLRKALARAPDKTVVVTISRKSEAQGETPQSLEISVPANPMRTLGLVMDAGPIRSIRLQSPAATAGLRVDDKLLSIDGQPVGDPFTLQQRMLIKARTHQPVAIQVKRMAGSDSEELDIQVHPVLPGHPSVVSSKTGLAIESLGITLPIRNVVIEHSATDADPSSLLAGDKVTKVKINLNEEQGKIKLLANLSNEVDLHEHPEYWAEIRSNFQSLAPGTKVDITFHRDQVEQSTTLTIRTLDEYFQETRGVRLQLVQEFYQAPSAWEAIKLGGMQTVDDASRVLKFLKKLVGGDLSIKQFGGPGTIAMVATSEASQGTSRLLLFLTLLSANLAIINFLPIPILDGGHMIFLAFEGIFRRPVGEKLQVALSIVGFIFLLTLMVTVIGLDVWRIFL